MSKITSNSILTRYPVDLNILKKYNSLNHINKEVIAWKVCTKLYFKWKKSYKTINGTSVDVIRSL